MRRRSKWLPATYCPPTAQPDVCAELTVAAPCTGPRGMVGARGFEPPTLSSRTTRATKLRHAPTEGARRPEPEGNRHQPEDDGQPSLVPEDLGDPSVDVGPQRADAEREREVQRERHVADLGWSDIGEKRLELRTLGEREQAHDHDREPEAGGARADEHEDREPDPAADVDADDERLPAA